MWDWAKLPSHSTNTGNCGRRYGVSVNLHTSRGRKSSWSVALAQLTVANRQREFASTEEWPSVAASSGNQSGPGLFPDAPTISISKQLVACQGRATLRYCVFRWALKQKLWVSTCSPSILPRLYFQDKLHATGDTHGVQIQRSNHTNSSTNFHTTRNFPPLSHDWCLKSVKLRLWFRASKSYQIFSFLNSFIIVPKGKRFSFYSLRYSLNYKDVNKGRKHNIALKNVKKLEFIISR